MNVLDKTAPPAGHEEKEEDPEEKDGKAASGAPHVLDRPHPRRAADRAAGHRLPAQGRRRRRPASFTGPLSDGLPATSTCCPGWPASAMRPARHQELPRGHQARPRRAAVLGRPHHRHPARAHQAVEQARARGDTALDPQSSPACGNATTPPSAGIIHNRLRDLPAATTPATPLAPGCAAIRSRFSCSPGTSASTGPITSASAVPQPPSAPGRLRLLAFLATLAAVVPHSQLPRLRRRPRRQRTRTPSSTAPAGKPWLPPLPAAA